MQAAEVDEPRAVRAAPMVEYVPPEPTVRQPEGALVLAVRRVRAPGAARALVASDRAASRVGQCILMEAIARLKEDGYLC